jgi:DNA-binding transcriptional LysR family regulator
MKRVSKLATTRAGDMVPSAEGLSAEPEFDWNDLKYFLAVARQGGLSRAALDLGTSPSTVSRHVSALESRLKVRLFVRLPTGYLLTDAGSELFERVAEVERSTHAVVRRGSLAGESDQVSGLVRFASADSVGTYVLAPRMGWLRQRYPLLRVALLLGHAPVDLSRREADVALRIFDSAEPVADPDHILQRVCPVPFDLYVARTLLGDADPGRVDWLSLPHVGWDASWRHLPLARWLSTTFPKPPVVCSNSLAAQLSAVQAGLGVGLLPRYMAHRDAHLVRLPAAPPAARELWLVYHRDLRSSRRVQAIRDFVQAVVPSAVG